MSNQRAGRGRRRPPRHRRLWCTTGVGRVRGSTHTCSGYAQRTAKGREDPGVARVAERHAAAVDQVLGNTQVVQGGRRDARAVVAGGDAALRAGDLGKLDLWWRARRWAGRARVCGSPAGWLGVKGVCGPRACAQRGARRRGPRGARARAHAHCRAAAVGLAAHHGACCGAIAVTPAEPRCRWRAGAAMAGPAAAGVFIARARPQVGECCAPAKCTQLPVWHALYIASRELVERICCTSKAPGALCARPRSFAGPDLPPRRQPCPATAAT